ncbi:MAG: right-handed parallel beta-helix repeat-containing protein, partial [Planctomycetes bacterium]|nr:right-handed parallel beta-helix repeat-containing protein [Planctomycetota bacterium]
LLMALSLHVTGSASVIHVPADYTTIQEALNAAYDGDNILVEPGTYNECIDFLGKAVHLQSTAGPDDTILDGQEAGSVVSFQSGEGPDSILEGFLITNGTGTTLTDVGRCGGGIYCLDASPTIRDNIVSANHVIGVDMIGLGGGIYCIGEALISGNLIRSNRIEADILRYGGGIYCEGAVRIEGNVFQWNHTGRLGDGIYCKGDALISGNLMGNMIFCIDSTATISCNTFRDYDKKCGIECWYSSPTIEENRVIGVDGIYLYQCPEAEILNNIISDNRTRGISLSNSPAVVENNIITGNRTYNGYGSGIGISVSSPLIRNNVIAGNRALRGGGISISHDAYPQFENNLVAENSAEVSGGAVYCYGVNATITVTNSIFWGNSAPDGKEMCVEGLGFPTINISYSDLEGGQASVSGTGILNWGAGMIDADPLFAAGPEGFYYLSQVAAGQADDSPCINAGSDTAANLGMDLLWTRNDETADAGVVDLGFHFGEDLTAYPWLSLDAYTICTRTGGSSVLHLHGGADKAFRNYFVLGGVSGIYPGTPLPGNQAMLWLNCDFFTDFVVANMNSSFFDDFFGALDENGAATATVDTLVPIPDAVGAKLYFAYALGYPWEFASNPVVIDLVP